MAAIRFMLLGWSGLRLGVSWLGSQLIRLCCAYVVLSSMYDSIDTPTSLDSRFSILLFTDCFGVLKTDLLPYPILNMSLTSRIEDSVQLLSYLLVL